MLGHDGLVAQASWPKADAKYLQDETVTIAVQVRGKLRGTIEAQKDASKEELEAAALALPKIATEIEGKELKKVIVVPGRIVNIVY